MPPTIVETTSAPREKLFAIGQLAGSEVHRTAILDELGPNIVRFQKVSYANSRIPWPPKAEFAVSATDADTRQFGAQVDGQRERASEMPDARVRQSPRASGIGEDHRDMDDGIHPESGHQSCFVPQAMLVQSQVDRRPDGAARATSSN